MLGWPINRWQPTARNRRSAEGGKNTWRLHLDGISESSPTSVGAIWNSNILIDHDGAILNHHRKLVPTFYEKLIWALGDGAGLKVSNMPAGRVGNLICGENTNPLARYSLMAQAEQVSIAS